MSPPDQTLIKNFQKYSRVKSNAQEASLLYLRQRFNYQLHVLNTEQGKPTRFKGLELVPGDQYPNSFFMDKPIRDRPKRFKKLPTITLIVETDIKKQSKRMGAISEIQVFNDKFDDRVFIDTKAPKNLVLSILRSEPIQKEILFLLENNWVTISLFHPESPVRLSYDVNKPPPADQVDHYLTAINQLALQLPEIETKLPSISTQNLLQKKEKFSLQERYLDFLLVFLVTAAYFFTRAGYLQHPEILDQEFFSFVDNVQFGLGVLSLGLVFFIQQVSPRSMYLQLKHWLLFCLVCIYPISFVIEQINYHFDDSDIETLEVSILEKNFDIDTDSGEPSRYYARFTITNEEDEEFERVVDITADDFAAYNKDSVLLFYREGYLGYRWMESFMVK